MLKIVSRGLPAAAAVVALFACGDPTGSGGGGGTGAVARMDVVSGDLQRAVAGTELPQPLVVRVVDDKGKPVRGQVVNFRVTAGGGSVFAGAASTNADGEARERWTLGTAAGDTQRVEVRAVDAATGAAQVFATFRAVATADVPAAVAIVQVNPFTGMAGLPLADSVIARVNDRYGNPVVGATVVWTVRAGGGSASPTQGTTDAAGRVRTSWTLGARLDSVQVLEAAAGLTLKAQAQAAATGLAGGSVSKVSGDAQTGAPATPLAQPLVVVVRAAGGAPVRGASVTWSTPNGTLAPSSGVTDANGQASASWTLPAAVGSVTASAAVAGVGVVTFTAVSVGGAATRLDSLPSGTVPPGGALTLKVVARDAQGYAVPGATVSWSVASGGGSIPPQSLTDANGIASAVWQTGATSGAQTAEARIPGAPAVLFVRQAPAAGGLQMVRGDGQAVMIRTRPSPLAVGYLPSGPGNSVLWQAYAGSSATPFESFSLPVDPDGVSRYQWRAENLPNAETLPPVRVTATAGSGVVAFNATTVAGLPSTIRVMNDTIWLYSLYETATNVGFLFGSDGINGRYLVDRSEWLWTPLENNGVVTIEGSGNISRFVKAQANGTVRIEAEYNPRVIDQAYADQFRHDTFTVIARQRLAAAGFRPDGRTTAVLTPGQTVTPYGLDAEVVDQVRLTRYQSVIPDVVWTSSNPGVARVNADNTVTAVAPGTAVIYGTAGGATLPLTVTVWAPLRAGR